MIQSAEVNSNSVEHACSTYNLSQKFRCKEFLMSLVNQPVPGPWQIALHSDCATDMILHI